MGMNLNYELNGPVADRQSTALENLVKAVENLPNNARNADTLDATFGAMLDGTNTTEIFWKWWPLSAANGDTKYARLCRFAKMAAQAWRDKKYTLRSFNAAVSGDSAMTPMDDLAGKTAAQLCTEETEATADWADDDPMTWYIRAQALSLADGTMNITFLEGEDGFDITGEHAPVYTFALALWVNEYTDGNYDYVSFSTTQKEGFYPLAGDVGMDNQKRDLTWHPTFPGGLNADGALTSGAGRAPYNNASANAGITAARKMTAYEGLWNDCDTKWLLLMWQLRHFNLENSGILEGCTSYDKSATSPVAEENTTRFLVASGQGAQYVVGSNVSIGEMAEETTKDRSTVTKTPIALNVKIGSITTGVEVGGTTYDALNLVLDAPINLTTTAMLFTMPYYSGDTEAIPGHKDGSRVSLTAGKTPARIAGIEVLDGAYAIGLDPLYNVTWDAEAHTGVYAIHECRDSEKLAGSITANYRDTGIVGGPIGSSWHYVKAFIRTKLGVLFPSIVDNGASSSTYYKSAFYGAVSSGVRAPWRFADLISTGHAGLAAEHGNLTPSSAGWSGRPRLSGSGKKRGEWAA